MKHIGSVYYDIAEKTLKHAISLGAEDVIVRVTRVNKAQLRFWNNKFDIFKRWYNTYVNIFLAKGKRIIEGTTGTTELNELFDYVKSLIKRLQILKPKEDYYGIAEGPFKYPVIEKSYDPKIPQLEASEVADIAEEAINASLEEGTERCAGTVYLTWGSLLLTSSHNIQASYDFTRIYISLRAFIGKLRSGHGVSVSRMLNELAPSEAGREAGYWAKLATSPRKPRAGTFTILFGNMAAANLISEIGPHVSASLVDKQLSMFTGRLNERVASEIFTLIDNPLLPNTYGATPFDQEGHPTSKITIISKGTLRSLLHNTSTARKFKVKSTGNAGMINPRPWNLVVLSGDADFDEMISEIKRGYLVTNNWYMRYTSFRTGDFSTISRDACFWIENGEIKYSVSRIRISDNMLKLLNNIRLVSKDVKQVYWWETLYPVITPSLLIENVRVTMPIK